MCIITPPQLVVNLSHSVRDNHCVSPSFRPLSASCEGLIASVRRATLLLQIFGAIYCCGCILTFKSLDSEYMTLFQTHFQVKRAVLYRDQYGSVWETLFGEHLEMLSEIERTHRWGIGGPAGRTHLTVRLHKLERLHDTKRLFYTTAHWKVVHTHVFHNTVWINDKQAPEGE